MATFFGSKARDLVSREFIYYSLADLLFSIRSDTLSWFVAGSLGFVVRREAKQRFETVTLTASAMSSQQWFSNISSKPYVDMISFLSYCIMEIGEWANRSLKVFSIIQQMSMLL